MPGHVRARKGADGKPKKRADGSTIWQARWRPADDPSDRAREERSFKTKREAERWIASRDSDVLRGAYAPAKRGETPFARVADEWRGTWADLAPKTQGGYESILNQHLLPAFGAKPIVAITNADVQRFANDLAATRAPNTVRRVLDPLRGVFRLAVERRYIPANPCKSVRLPRKGEGRTIDIDPLTHNEVRALVAALPEHWRLPVLLDAYTGLRAGELWALRRRDVDALRGELAVNEALKEVTRSSATKVRPEHRITDSLIVGPTKTYATRRVSVPAFLRDELAAHLARPLPGGDDPAAFIFTTPTGEAVRHNLFYKRTFAPVVAATSPGRARRFHDLRHTCAAWLIDAGAHPLQIKIRLGYKEIRTTMDTYGHLFPSAEPELAGLLDAGYRGAEPDNVTPLRAAD